MSARVGFRSIAIASLGVLATASAVASPPRWTPAKHHHDREVEYARVVDVEPLVRRVRITAPQRECWDETRQVYPEPQRARSSAGAMIVGGLIGGVIGHQFDRGDRRTGTLAGSVIGAAIGHDVGSRRVVANNVYVQPIEQTVQRCDVSYRDEWEERIDGYRVTYLYNGREYTTRMPYDPGKRVRVNVDVSPAW